MARVTVEDCIKYVPNRFELVILAAKRARQLAKGYEPTMDPGRDKFTVLALREIGEGKLDIEALRNYVEPEHTEEEQESEISAEARVLLEEESQLLAGRARLGRGAANDHDLLSDDGDLAFSDALDDDEEELGDEFNVELDGELDPGFGDDDSL